MATGLAVKRMAKERKELEKENPDYFVVFKDDNLLKFDAYVVGPEDSLYRHKLVKLHFDIPCEYPMKPPTVKFIQHTGDRIHPNLYVDGKVCLSILGTWQGEPWAYSMTCHTVLIVVRSLLDNEPYKHEPGKGDNPEFNAFVQYSTWKFLLLDYLDREAEPAAKAWLQTYVRQNGQDMLRDLARQHAANARRTTFSCPYKNARVQADYPRLIRTLQEIVSALQPRPVETTSQSPLLPPPPSETPLGLVPLVTGPSRPVKSATVLKRKYGPEADDVPWSQIRVQKQKPNQVVVSPDAGAREPEKKKRAKRVEIIDLT
ncbi:Ubiquitin-conjugating enzyme E2 Z [Cytospora mali]|uniref:Ubiquitin-conjugating enzyme E2 Z n=1 Tax=Cytospora mali TaxID=578113 RepID=A0A194UTQ1_CYTMA|nr:Ubiquitin-conjugating enzyme E2 Z [Valsa mali var. pyri (nom. inval.)]